MGPFPALTPAYLSSLLFQHTPHPRPCPSVLHTLQFLECSLFSLPALPLHVLLPPWAISLVSQSFLGCHSLQETSQTPSVRAPWTTLWQQLSACTASVWCLLPLLHWELVKGRTCSMFTIHTTVTGTQNAHHKSSLNYLESCELCYLSMLDVFQNPSDTSIPRGPSPLYNTMWCSQAAVATVPNLMGPVSYRGTVCAKSSPTLRPHRL